MNNKAYITAVALTMLTFAGASAQIFKGWSVGLHTGMDIGGAVPYPISGMGEGAKMSATPRLSPALGASITARLDPHWTLTFEATYKQVEIDASAWVSGQHYSDREDKNIVLSFRGSADINMKFSMVEMPLLAAYNFKGKDNRILLGWYYSKIVDANFSSTPIKGVLTNVTHPDEAPAPVTPDDPYTQNFNNDLDNWDTGFLLGYEWRAFERVRVGARFSMGVKDIFKRNCNYFDYKMLHMRGTLVLSYDILSGK